LAKLKNFVVRAGGGNFGGNFMNYKRILVVGDIHGCFERLVSLWKKISVTDDDLVIFLGDYVDRGRENVKVLKFIMSENEKENVIALCGNHEDMLLTDILAGQSFSETLREIAMQKLKEPDFEDKVFKFLKNLPYKFEMEINGKEYFFCHAGVNPKIPFDEQDEIDLLWIREKFFTVYDGEKIVVVGHTPVMFLPTEEEIQKKLENFGEEIFDEVDDEYKESSFYVPTEKALQISKCKPQWRRGGKILMMDTGSFLPKGCISCVDLVSGDLWQSD